MTATFRMPRWYDVVTYAGTDDCYFHAGQHVRVRTLTAPDADGYVVIEDPYDTTLRLRCPITDLDITYKYP